MREGERWRNAGRNREGSQRERERGGRKEQRRIKIDNIWQQMSYTGICHPLGKIL